MLLDVQSLLLLVFQLSSNSVQALNATVSVDVSQT